jgi:hypothetical protein
MTIRTTATTLLLLIIAFGSTAFAPRPGDLVVWKRQGTYAGHVGFATGSPYCASFTTWCLEPADAPFDSLTPQNVYRHILECEIKHPEIVYRQAVLESGNFGSKNCLRNNNLFGMKHPGRRKTLSLGQRGQYAYYTSWKQSIEDYKLWQDAKPITGDYYSYLAARGYCELGGRAYQRLLSSVRMPAWIHTMNTEYGR